MAGADRLINVLLCCYCLFSLSAKVATAVTQDNTPFGLYGGGKRERGAAGRKLGVMGAITKLKRKPVSGLLILKNEKQGGGRLYIADKKYTPTDAGFA